MDKPRRVRIGDTQRIFLTSSARLGNRRELTVLNDVSTDNAIRTAGGSGLESAPTTTRMLRPALTPSGVCHGTLGELFQGPFVYDERAEIAIISLPIDKFSWVYFIEGETPLPLPFDGRQKSAEAVDLFCATYDVTLPTGRWEFYSEIPVGQGMASSTADVVATIRCLYNVFAIPYSEAGVRLILSAIERADSVFLSEFALYMSRKHEVIYSLGAETAFFSCYIIEPGFVKTDDVTEQLVTHYENHLYEYERVRRAIVDGFRKRCRSDIAAASTRSAELAQLVLPKRHFEVVRGYQEYFGADGLVVAHTGTILGYLFSRRPSRALMDELSGFFRDLDLQSNFSRSGF
jgi:L-threonine kinase